MSERLALVPVRGTTWLDRRALSLAMSLYCEVIAVHLVGLEGPEACGDKKALEDRWAREIEAPCRAAGLQPPGLVVEEAVHCGTCRPRPQPVPMPELD